jgi:thiosulfate dehydrogenase [quinone] large subunit
MRAAGWTPNDGPVSGLSGLVPAGWLFLRLVIGFEWMRAGWEKVGDAAWTEAPRGAAVEGFLNGAVAKSATGDHPEVHGWFATLSEDLFIPNATLLAYLVAYGELFVGMALVLGVLTRFAALAGVTMNLAFLWAGTTSTNPSLMLIGLGVVVLGARAGELGVDRWLMPRLTGVVGHEIVRVGRYAAVTAGVAFLALMALAASDTQTWLVAAAVAVIVTVLAANMHLPGPAPARREHPRPVH